MKPKRRAPSFTLVEMLVSVAVFSLLVLLLFSLMSNATQLWRQQSTKEESYREARSALNTISRDLNGALTSTNNNSWYYSNGTNQLAFLTTLPNTAQGPTVALGDICAVGYSLEWSTNDASGFQTNMSLYRYICFSNPTYATFLQPVVPPSVSTIFKNPDGINTVRTLIARDVAQVSFSSYTVDSSGVPTPLLDSTTPVTVMPNIIDVSMTVLNDRVALRLASKVQWQNTNTALFQQNQESFNLRVRPQVP